MRKGLLSALIVSASLTASAVHAQPTISKVFSPSTIGPASVSTITFTITNGGGAPVTDLAFTDVLPTVPGDVDIATPANASTTCIDGVVTAPDGGGTITFSDGRLGAGGTCTVTVDVTASTPGVHTNPAITLTSSAGSSMSLPVNLTVVTTRPGFAKSFAPGTVPIGQRSTLTFTIDNSANASDVGSLDFIDNLPSGMVIADPANASTTCGSVAMPPTLTADAGTSVVILDADGNFVFPSLAAGATCTVVVDVVGTGAGSLVNVTELLADFTSAGKASAALDVTVSAFAIRKSFTDDPVAPGGTVTLELVLDNFDRNFSATDIAFTDDLTTLVPALAGLTFDSVLSNDCGGMLTGVGGTTIGFSAGTLGPEGSCTIRVSLAVPAGATPGVFTNTTSAVTATVGGAPVVGNMAVDDLFVEPTPILTKAFLEVGTLAPDPIVTPGDDVVLRFTITNPSTTSGATDIAFIDELTDGEPDSGFLPFPVSVTLPPVPDPPCGPGSSLSLVGLGTERQGLSLIDGALDPAPGAGSTCTFDVTLTIPADLSGSVYTNTTREITAVIDGDTRTGDPASDTLTVIAAPDLTKLFTDDPVAPGGSVTLEFVLEYPGEAPGDATGITFTDDLAPVLAGLVATGLPITEACDPDGPGGDPGTGTLSGSAGDTLLTFMGGALSPGESCTIQVTLDVPMGASPGSFTNTTSGVGATVAGLPATSPPASDDLGIAGLTFAKAFLGDPVIAGGTVTLRFTIDNIHPTDDADGVFFTDNLAAELPGLAATGPPSTDTCGGTLTGTTFLIYVGGMVASGASCVIEVEVLVPPGADDGSYLNLTSSLTANQGGIVVIDPATDFLTVASTLIQLDKSFTDDPVAPGDSVTLELVLTNLDAARAASDIDFTDDLGAALTGLTFDSVLLNDCGATISGTGTDMITVMDAAVGAGASCTMRLSLTVPGAAAAGLYTNTTSAITGMIGGFPVDGDPASDELEVVQLLEFSKSFDGPTTATGGVTLTFTITNPGAETATNIDFSDDLDAVISGLIATSLPAQPCGAGSSITGISFLTMNGGSLPPMGGTCSFDVELLVPASATAGTFPNVTSDLFRDGLTVSDPATADLVIEPPPTFAKVFMPDAILAGGTSTLRFTIDNSASSLAASALDFTDMLPSGVFVATPSVTANTCGGTLTATAGSGEIDLTGGSVGAGATCTIDVDVTSIVTGAHVNTTGDLTSSSGNSGTATDTLMVSPSADLSVTKTDGVTAAAPGTSVTYMITVANAGPSADPSVMLADTFPSPPLTCTYTSVASGGATGNTAAGAGDLAETLSMPAGSAVTYTAVCAIDSDATGTLSNTATVTPSVTDLAPGNNSATDDDTVLVPSADLTITKSDGVTSAVPGQDTLIYTIIASNIGPSDDPMVSVTDMFPAELSCTFTSMASGGATGNTAAGMGDLAETLALPAGAAVTYTVTCVIDPAATGTLSNTATISGSVSDPVPGNNSATDDDTVLTPETDLSITKEDSPDPAIRGGDLTYTITVTNNGPSASTGATVTDVLPSGVSFSASADCSEAGGTVTCAIGALGVGASQMVSFVVTLDPGPAAIIENTATVASNETDPESDNDSATASTTVNPQPGFTKAFAPDSILPGEISVLTLTIDNSTSTVDATSLDFTDNLPSSVIVATPANASTTCVGGTLTAVAGSSVITYTGGTATAGTSCTVSVDVTSADVGTHVNVTGDLTSSLGNSGTATATLTVEDAEPPIVTAVGTEEGPLAECDSVRPTVTAMRVTIEDTETPVLNTDDPASYLLVEAGPDATFSTTDCSGVAGDDVAVGILGISQLGSDPLIAEVSLQVPTLDGLYRFLVCDTITDTGGNALDGDGDTMAGGDFVLSFFRADPLNLFANGHFDDCPVSLDPWVTVATPPNTVDPGAPGTDDVDASPLSAAARFTHSAESPSAIGQCVPVIAGVHYDLDASYRFAPPMGAVASFSQSCEFFDAPACGGASLGSSTSLTVIEDQGGAWIDTTRPLTPPSGARSALCDFSVDPVGDDPNFDLFLDALTLGRGIPIFADGFESGDTSAWSSTVP